MFCPFDPTALPPAFTLPASRFQQASYPLQYHSPVRWSDAQGPFIGRIAVAQFFEDLRTLIMGEVIGAERFRQGAWRAMLRSIHIEHLAAGEPGQPVTLAGGFAQLGRSSYRFAQAIFQGGRCLAVGEAVSVVVGDDMRPTDIPPEVRALMERHLVPAPVGWTPARETLHEQPLAAYPFQGELPTRFSDTDAVGHVNNVAMFRYVDNALSAFQFQCEGRMAPCGDNGAWWVARQATSLQAESFYGSPIQFGVGVESIDTDRVTLGLALYQNGRCTNVARTVFVPVADGRTVPVSGELRYRLQCHGLKNSPPDV